MTHTVTGRVWGVLAMVAVIAGVFAPAGAAAAVKPGIDGMVSQVGYRKETRASVEYFVINVTWAELQPDASVLGKSGVVRTGRQMNTAKTPDIAADNPIDLALATVAASGGRWKGIKVRLFAGFSAPQWVKDDFGSVTLTRFAGGTATAPKFWNWSSPNGRSQGYAYGGAYGRLQRALARYYDNPSTSPGAAAVREVTIAGCMTEFAEPMVRNRADTAALWAAGYRETADAACQRGQVDVSRYAWKNTVLSLAVNPYTRIVDASTSVNDVEKGKEFARYCRDKLGSRCLLQNNELCRADPNLAADQAVPVLAVQRWLGALNDPKSPAYEGAARSGPLAFQTEAPTSGTGSWSDGYPVTRAGFLDCINDAATLYRPDSLEIRSSQVPEDPATTTDADLRALETLIRW